MTTLEEPRADAAGSVPLSRRTVPFGARLAAAGLVLGAGANTLQAVLGQVVERPDEVADQIRVFNEHEVLFTTMHLAGTLAVPFMAIGFVAAAHLLARRARRTGWVAGTMLVVGMFGFLAVHVAEMIQLAAILDPEGEAAATYLHGMDGAPLLAVTFGLPFLIGAPLGLLVLCVGLLVVGARVPRWIPAAWLVFAVLDFTIGGVGPVDPHWLYLLGAVGLAHHVLRDGAAAWRKS
ncbi:hypothetical protein [Nocardioides coralli]|uniref:hypothetical protein n=1 Tax=Nocardioides coralli TaxID=2872154 RepID=UPI001CA42F20|nr:hypothetical protein [Nocardioides coralli]QZY27875.1 hypothetical protein K6T13_10200 [Nocardioides coralli]